MTRLFGDSQLAGTPDTDPVGIFAGFDARLVLAGSTAAAVSCALVFGPPAR